MIVFVHLLNDCSGSPRVLASAISALSQADGKNRLFLGSEGAGCLTAAGVPVSLYWYRRTPYRTLTLGTYLLSQIWLMYRLFRSSDIEPNALIYVNTLLPFGAAVYGWLTGRRVIYHIHEVGVGPALLQRFLVNMVRSTAAGVIYVSEFQSRQLLISVRAKKIVYNCVNQAIAERAAGTIYSHRHNGNFNVLMLASLRDYKGVPEYVALAERLKTRGDLCFMLVVNDDEATLDRYFGGVVLPSNLRVVSRTGDPSQYYENASVVVNLSRPDLCVESFGLTVLEAMTFGIPVIAPPLGGPAELVSDCHEGFLVDSRCGDALAQSVLRLADDEGLCLRMSKAAGVKAARYSADGFAESLRKAVSAVVVRG